MLCTSASFLTRLYSEKLMNNKELVLEDTLKLDIMNGRIQLTQCLMIKKKKYL